MKTIVIGVIGADVHAVGNKIIEYVLKNEGYNVVNIGVLSSQEDFINAAIETNADLILVSSLYGQGEIDCRGMREACIEAGIGDIPMFVGGNIVVGKQNFDDVRKRFETMGFNKVYGPGVPIEVTLPDIKEVLGEQDMSRYLMIDFGSTFTKLTAVDTECEDIIATASHFTTVDTDITVGYKNALSDLCKKLGEESPKFDKIIGCSSAAGGLKMAAVGLVRELTVEAARRVCLGVFSLDGKMVDKPVMDRAEKILRKAKAYKLI